MGDRYGEVVHVQKRGPGGERVFVRLDKSGKTIGFRPENVMAMNPLSPAVKRGLWIGGVAAGAVAIVIATAAVASAAPAKAKVEPGPAPPPGPAKPETVTYKGISITITPDAENFRASWTMNSKPYDRTGHSRDSVLEDARNAIDQVLKAKPEPLNIKLDARSDDGVLQLRASDSLDYAPYNGAAWDSVSVDAPDVVSVSGSHFVAQKPGTANVTGTYKDVLNDVAWTRKTSLVVHVIAMPVYQPPVWTQGGPNDTLGAGKDVAITFTLANAGQATQLDSALLQIQNAGIVSDLKTYKPSTPVPGDWPPGDNAGAGPLIYRASFTMVKAHSPFPQQPVSNVYWTR